MNKTTGGTVRSARSAKRWFDLLVDIVEAAASVGFGASASQMTTASSNGRRSGTYSGMSAR